MIQEQILSDEQKEAMYMKCSKKQLIHMLIEANKSLCELVFSQTNNDHAIFKATYDGRFTCKCKGGKQGRTVDDDFNQICDVCGKY